MNGLSTHKYGMDVCAACGLDHCLVIGKLIDSPVRAWTHLGFYKAQVASSKLRGTQSCGFAIQALSRFTCSRVRRPVGNVNDITATQFCMPHAVASLRVHTDSYECLGSDGGWINKPSTCKRKAFKEEGLEREQIVCHLRKPHG